MTAKERQAGLRAQGRCFQCKQPSPVNPATGHAYTLCDVCRAKYLKARRERYYPSAKKRDCVECGRPTSRKDKQHRFVMCESCRADRRRRYAEAK